MDPLQLETSDEEAATAATFPRAHTCVLRYSLWLMVEPPSYKEWLPHHNAVHTFYWIGVESEGANPLSQALLHALLRRRIT